MFEKVVGGMGVKSDILIIFFWGGGPSIGGCLTIEVCDCSLTERFFIDMMNNSTIL